MMNVGTQQLTDPFPQCQSSRPMRQNFGGLYGLAHFLDTLQSIMVMLTVLSMLATAAGRVIRFCRAFGPNVRALRRRYDD